MKIWVRYSLIGALVVASGMSAASSALAAPKQAAVAPEDYEYNASGVYDPIEPLNRGIFKFNEAIDSVVMKPIAKGYKFIVPKYGRERVHNVVTNLGEPVDMLNGFIQGNPERGFTAMWRFILNSTLGVLGIFDFAGHNLNLVHVDEDFGQSMGHYGWGGGPYIVLPILGPSNGRDVFGRVVDVFSNPFNYSESDTFVYTRIGVTALDARSRNLELIDDVYATSVDPYATLRSMYTQRRDALISNNQPKSEGVGY